MEDFVVLLHRLAYGLGDRVQRLPRPNYQRVSIHAWGAMARRQPVQLSVLSQGIGLPTWKLTFPASKIGSSDSFLCQVNVGSFFSVFRENLYSELSIRDVWGVMLENKKICLDLTGQEQAWLVAIYA